MQLCAREILGKEGEFRDFRNTYCFRCLFPKYDLPKGSYPTPVEVIQEPLSLQPKF